ncbi:MAG: winged helix-turn-helix domain-containing protein [Bifidobacteriaceae bacterium]|jgi:hypothetical protein|nr:winged helix-turn-helix domain-containing protein [Bifidobacteriaceae bacterium]
MTATAYSPTLTPIPVLPWRRRPSYRGPLVVIPGGRAAARRAEPPSWPRTPPPAAPSSVSPESAESVRAFRHRLARLPIKPEIRLDPARRSVRVDGAARHLTPREFDLLAALAAQPGQPISREELLQVGARERTVGEGSRTVDVHVAHLRDKLRLPGVIATVRGSGYALNPAYRVEIA